MGCGSSDLKAKFETEQDKTSKLQGENNEKSKKISELEDSQQQLDKKLKSNDENYRIKLKTLEENLVNEKQNFEVLEKANQELAEKVRGSEKILENEKKNFEELKIVNQELAEKVRGSEIILVGERQSFEELKKVYKELEEKVRGSEENLVNEKKNFEELKKVNQELVEKVRGSEQNLVNEKEISEELKKVNQELKEKLGVLEKVLVNQKHSFEQLEKVNQELADKVKVFEITFVNQNQNFEELTKVNQKLAEKVTIFEEQIQKIQLSRENRVIDKTLDLSMGFEKKKIDLNIELPSQFEVKPIKQVLNLFHHQVKKQKPEQSISSFQMFCKPDTEHQKTFIHLHLNRNFSYKSGLNFQKDSQILIEKTLPQLVFSQFNITLQGKSYNSDSTHTMISLPPSDIDNFSQSIQSDSSALFKLPVTHYLTPATQNLANPFQSPCISTKDHIFSFTPSNIFKYFTKYNSFKPTCSLCSSSKFYQFWSCEHCSLIICPSCKPLCFKCPSGHSYTQSNALEKFSCSSCSREKVSMSLYCEPCSIQLCDLCALLRTQAKFECDNSHKLKPGSSDLNCSICSKEGSLISCECSGICQICFEYIDSPIFYHPGLNCENGHLLHTVESREKCSVCEEEKEYLYYCKDCSLFVCDSCGDSYVKALYERPLCKKMHKLEVDYAEEGNSSIKGQVGLKKFYCELCDSSFSLKSIPIWGKTNC